MTVTSAADPRRFRLRISSGTSSARLLPIGALIVGTFVLLALLAPVLSPHDPNRQDIMNRLASPGSEHWLGTDPLGRDILTRLIYAARVDLPLGLVLALGPALVGTTLGLIAGYSGGTVDAVTMRTADMFQAFPSYIFIIALVTVLQPGARSMIIAFTALGWVVYARLIRAEVLRVREHDYILAARVGGIPRRRVLLRHVLPNTIGQVFVYLPGDVLLAIVTLASLSYLGVGVQPPTAEWGSMIADGRGFATTQWWIVVAPGVTLVVLGLGLTALADGLDDRLRRR